MGEGGSPLMKLLELIIGLVIVGMVLSALQAALCQLMPVIVATLVAVGGVWLVATIVRYRRSRW